LDGIGGRACEGLEYSYLNRIFVRGVKQRRSAATWLVAQNFGFHAFVRKQGPVVARNEGKTVSAHIQVAHECNQIVQRDIDAEYAKQITVRRS